MAHLIDKDALVAEIEKLKDNAHNGVSYHQSRQNIGLENELSTWEHLENAFATVLKIINTLEVKDVDLDFQMFAKEMDTVFNLPSSETENTEENPLNWEFAIAKHFFELGLKAQKGE